MNEHYLYFICGAGFASFLCWSLSAYFRNGWEYPYKYYIFSKALWSLLYLFYFPFWDDLLGSYLSTLIRVVISAAIPPLLLLEYARITHVVRSLSFHTITSILLPFLVGRYCFAFVDNKGLNIFLLVVCLLFIVVLMQRILHRINDYDKRLKDYLADPDTFSSRTVKIWVHLLSFVTIFYFFHYFRIEVLHLYANFSITLTLGVSVLLPLFLIFERQFEHQKWFEDFDAAYAPINHLTNDLFLDNRRERNVVIQATHNAHNVSYAQRAMTRLATQQEDPKVENGWAFLGEDATDDLEKQYCQIDDRLHILEKTYTTYVDPEFSLARLAKMLHVSRLKLIEYLHYRGTSFYDYTANMRVAFAVLLMERNPDMSNEQLAQHCGYSTPQGFVKAFDFVQGIPLAQFRKQL